MPDPSDHMTDPETNIGIATFSGDATAAELEAILATPTAETPDQAEADAILSTASRIAVINDKLRELGLPELGDAAGHPEVINAVSGPEMGLKRDDRAIALGTVALASRPEDGVYNRESVGTHRDESPEEQTWRKAINSLRDIERLPKAKRGTPEEAAAYEDRAHASAVAHNILRKLSDPDIADEDVLAETEQGALASLNFQPLPPGDAAETMKTIELRTPKHGHHAWDSERIDYLLTLRDEFNGVAYLPQGMAESPDGTGLDSFLGDNPVDRMVIVITIPGEDGEPDRRIAITDRIITSTDEEDTTRVEGGAIGAFYSYEEVPKGAGTWEEIFSLTKDEAIEMGAIKTTHRGDFDARLRKKLGVGEPR